MPTKVQTRKKSRKRTPTPKAGVKKQAAKPKTAAPRKRVAKKATSQSKATRTRGAAASKDTSGGYSDLKMWENKARKSGKEPALIRTLRIEHRHMASVMQVFSEQLELIESGQLVDPHLVYEIMDYMVTWPDRFHHPREDLIYARVAELDASAADEVDTLQRDHDNTAKFGRELLATIAQWRIGEVEGETMIENSRAYIAHIYEHMNIEEKVVFPHIAEVLSSPDWRELEAEDSLEPVSLPMFGPRVQRDYRNLARNIRRGLRRSAEQQVVVEWMGLEAFMETMDVVGMAYDASRHCAGEHFKQSVDDSVDILLSNPLTAPLRVTANNTKLTFSLLGEVADIYREVAQDLVKINRSRRDQSRLLQKRMRR